jgi:hypothetical protein
MNKEGFIKCLSCKLNCSIEKATRINEILENNFFISKKSKDIIINELINKLGVSETEANDIYNTSREVLKEEIKNSLMNTFEDKE